MTMDDLLNAKPPRTPLREVLRYRLYWVLPVTVTSLLIATVVGLLVLFAWLANSEDKQFSKNCLESGFNAAQCEILLSEHQNTRAAALIAGTAVGLSASQIGRR